VSQNTEKMTDCIFCNVVANKSEASFVYRDSCVCAIMDIKRDGSKKVGFILSSLGQGE